MGANPVVFDISSDEEVDPEEFEDFEDADFLEPGEADFKWLSELISEAEKEIDDDYSDEVIVVGEVNPIKPRSTSKSLNSSLDDLNDDCVILDDDPDKIVTVENDSADDGDELLVVGEKGQIPCRDYPHSRHLCAKFPFSSTPHDKHCSLCHCYVCDSIAPCVYWGSGVSATDHCHATDKGETWKFQRKASQLRKTASLQVPTLNYGGPHTNKIPSRNVMRMAPHSNSRTSPHVLNGTMNSNPSARSHNPISRSMAIHPCSTTNNMTAQNVVVQPRCQPSILSRSRSHHRSISHHPLAVRNNLILKDMHLDTSKFTQFVSPSMMPKRRVAGRGNALADQAMPNTSNRSCVSQYVTSSATVPPIPVTGLTAVNPSCWHDAPSDLNINLHNHQSSSHSNLNNIVTRFMNSMDEMSHQKTYQLNDHNPNNDQLRDINQSAHRNDVLLETETEASMFHVESVGQSANQVTFQPGNGIATATRPRSDANINWVNDHSQENSQFISENPQYTITGSKYEQFFVEANSHLTAESNADCLHVGSIENWPLEPNILSAEPTGIDTGMLFFDFETSWNGLTQS